MQEPVKSTVGEREVGNYRSIKNRVGEIVTSGLKEHFLYFYVLIYVRGHTDRHRCLKFVSSGFKRIF
jgi:hypothetical protein